MHHQRVAGSPVNGHRTPNGAGALPPGVAGAALSPSAAPASAGDVFRSMVDRFAEDSRGRAASQKSAKMNGWRLDRSENRFTDRGNKAWSG